MAGLFAALALAGDSGPVRARVVAGWAASASAADPFPRFATFGWVAPPLDSTTSARYAEYAGAGFGVTVLALDDSGRVEDDRRRLDACRPLGVRCLLLDRDLRGVTLADSASLVRADTVVARWRDDPAFLGWYLGDEPADSEYAALGERFAILRARDPAHPAWNNLRGRSQFATVTAFRASLEAYVAATRPSVLCDDEYEFLLWGDRGQMTENIATLAAVARAHGLPFWGIVQLVRHGPFRDVTPGMLRWQFAQWLAWGARGIGVFTYWTPPPDPLWNWQPAMIAWGSGERTPHYDEVRDVNQLATGVGTWLAGMRWLTTTSAGFVPAGGTAFVPGGLLRRVDGRATLGFFADSTGAPVVFVANADSLEGRTVTLAPAGPRRAWQLATDGVTWAPAAGPGEDVELPLAPGGFALLRFSGGIDSLAAGSGLRLAAFPNPARGAVRFVASGNPGVARLEVLDVAGRRVWSHAFAAGGGTVNWLGTRDGGGRLAPGAYLARLEDARGVQVRRVTWLGTP